MASLIPKIKIGLAQNRKEKHNLSFDCSTTANIGNIQPTMCREMAPNSKYKVKVSSLCRLASMPLPTFGRISLRHYHTFIPYVDIWQPFDAFMSGQHYKGYDNASFVPTSCPWFGMSSIVPFMLAYSDISIAPVDDLDHPYTISNTNTAWDGTVYDNVTDAAIHDIERFNTIWLSIRNNFTAFDGITGLKMFPFGAGSLKADDYGIVNLGDWCAPLTYDNQIDFTYDEDGNLTSTSSWFVPGNTPITSEGADLITKVGDYAILCKFKAPLKRLRQIFIGLGYQFSPYNNENLNPFKLLAYYKGWFSLFRPNREMTFADTHCYEIIKKISDKNGAGITSIVTPALWTYFIEDLMLHCYYYLPQDYFSMSVLRPGMSNQDTDFLMSSGANDMVSASGVQSLGTDSVKVPAQAANTVNKPGAAAAPVVSQNGYFVNPLTMKLAMRMLTWANKNTVLGRSIREYLKVHFGVTDTNAIDDDAVYRIGSSRTNINISDVMSTAESQQGYLGEYGGKGIGYSDSETFDFTADKFGVWITYTVVVPESGYYQGYMKENKHLNRYQFFNPEYDALGYQILERGEVMDDYYADGANWQPRTNFKRAEAFGFVPRYSEYKVGRNIVNGDLSIPGLYNSMGGYTLDRRLPPFYLAYGDGVGGANVGITRIKRFISTPSFVPSVIYDNFRRIDPTDHLGQYNRMFNVVTNDLDHFIIHNIFDVTAYMPMKSLSNSFDTIDKDDDGSIDVTHS